MRAILTYHSIDASSSPVSCSPETFGHHVNWLASGRVKVTTIEDLVTLPDDSDAVAITFDDGFVNFTEAAAPRLLDHGFPVTLFVVAGRVGQRNSWDDGPARKIPDLPLLDWPALVDLQEKGVTLGAHSQTHRRLPALTGDELEDEVQGCADQIEARAGRRPSLFAYPYGDVDVHSSRVVARVFPLACTTEFKPVSADSQPSALPRLDMRYFDGPGSLDAWGSPWFRARLNVRNRLRQVRRIAVSAVDQR